MTLPNFVQDLLNKPEAREIAQDMDLNKKMEQIANGNYAAYVDVRTAYLNQGKDPAEIDKLYQKNDLSRLEGWSNLPGMGLAKAAVVTTAIIGFGQQLQNMAGQDIVNFMEPEYAANYQQTLQATAAAEQGFNGALNGITQAMQQTFAPQMQMPGQQFGIGQGGVDMTRIPIPGLGNIG